MSDVVSLVCRRPLSSRQEAFQSALMDAGLPLPGRSVLSQALPNAAEGSFDQHNVSLPEIPNERGFPAPLARLKILRGSREGNEAIARLIAGNEETTRWVAEMVGRFRAALSCSISEAKIYPTRTALEKRIIAITQAVSTIKEAIEDHRLAPVLLGDSAFFDHQFEMLAGLEALKARSEAVSIRKGKGKDKHYARPTGLIEQVTCALMVAIAWREVRGTWPPHNNLEAQRACSELWSYAGGRAGWSDKENRSVDVWRDHLEAAKAAEESDEALQIQALVR